MSPPFKLTLFEGNQTVDHPWKQFRAIVYHIKQYYPCAIINNAINQ
jgi:hypothetical protein